MAKQSIRTLLVKLIVGELLFMLVTFLLYYVLFLNLAFSQQFLFPANYGETLAKETIENFQAGEATFESLPDFVEYALLDKDHQVIQSTLKQPANIAKILENPARFSAGAYQGRLVAGETEDLIVMYRLRSEFQNPWLRQHLPPAEPFFLVVSLVFLGIGLVAIVSYFAKAINRELKIVLDVNQSILAEDMTHDRQESSLKEIQAILTSLYTMEDALKESLQKEWRQKKQSEDSLRALTHDIKTPVALVSGNIELMGETDVTAEQQMYLDYAQKGIQRIDTYVSELRELSEPLPVAQALVAFDQQLIEELVDVVVQHGLIKNITCRVESHDEYPMLRVDKREFLKAFQNIVENSMRYGPTNSQISLDFFKSENAYTISICDEGPGFSQEALIHGKEQFFTENSGREGSHTGMGLAIATKIVQQQGGHMTLENRQTTRNTGGGRVEIKWVLA